MRVQDPFIGAAPNFPTPGYWSMAAFQKSGCLFKRSALMQMHAGICWQWGKNQPLVLAWWAILGKKGESLQTLPVQAATAHTLLITPRKHGHLPPPRSQLKFVAEMSTNGHPPVLPSCISVIWCEKEHMLPVLSPSVGLQSHVSVTLCSGTDRYS